MLKAFKKVTVFDCDWEVEFNYTKGESNPITLSSTQPNAEPELDILSISSVDKRIPEDIIELIEDDLFEVVDRVLWNELTILRNIPQ